VRTLHDDLFLATFFHKLINVFLYLEDEIFAGNYFYARITIFEDRFCLEPNKNTIFDGNLR